MAIAEIRVPFACLATRIACRWPDITFCASRFLKRPPILSSVLLVVVGPPLFRARCSVDETAEDPLVQVETLQVPSNLTTPLAASQEAEWLREALHDWLDNEYCPEPANEEISRRCAAVYYRCLVEKQVDVADILMRMIEDLENFSFKESFHGAFSSANAAVDLIVKRTESNSNSYKA